ncbi:MAG: hypothetical protein K8S27_10085 [Candidatus Omnitrophica bacterium]|nr:hypothetical protein [Candidatus Omnitrophota bacterium]
MAKTINTHKKGFILFLVLIVLISNLLTFFVSLYQTALLEHKNILQNMRHTLGELRRIGSDSDNIPTSINPPFITYVIDQKEGTFLVPRAVPFVRKKKDLWDYHMTKLIYQMQKQKEGEIHYPKESGLRDWIKGNNTILFTTLSEKGWIIAIEVYMESPIQIFKSRINKTLILNVLSILFFSALLMVLFVNRKLIVLSKLISDNLESGLVQMNTASEWSESMIKQDPTPEIEPGSSEINIVPTDHVLNIELSQNIEKPDDTTAPLGLTLNSPQASSPLSDAETENSFEPQLQIKTKPTQRIAHPAKPKPKKKLRKNISQRTKSGPDYNDLTLNLQEIKSPVLKKMINKIRNNK